MDEKKIIKYLKSLVHFDSDKSWLRANKKELINFMKHTSPRRNIGFGPFAVLRNMKFAAAALALLLFLGTGTGAAFASQESLPGDTLFSVKLFTEEIEKFLARNDEVKARLSIKFADRRIKEVIQLTANAENQGEENEEGIKNNIERFRLEIEEGERFFAKLDVKHKKNEDVLKLTLKFEDDLASHQDVLDQLEDLVPEQARGAIRAAREAAARGEAASFKLVLKIESKSEEDEGDEETGGGPSERGSERRAQGKINAAAHKINEVQRKIDKSSSSAAQEKLDEAVSLLERAEADAENNDFLSAFEGAQQVIRLSQDAKRLINEKPGEEEIGEEEEEEPEDEEEEDENGEENGEDENSGEGEDNNNN